MSILGLQLLFCWCLNTLFSICSKPESGCLFHHFLVSGAEHFDSKWIIPTTIILFTIQSKLSLVIPKRYWIHLCLLLMWHRLHNQRYWFFHWINRSCRNYVVWPVVKPSSAYAAVIFCICTNIFPLHYFDGEASMYLLNLSEPMTELSFSLDKLSETKRLISKGRRTYYYPAACNSRKQVTNNYIQYTSFINANVKVSNYETVKSSFCNYCSSDMHIVRHRLTATGYNGKRDQRIWEHTSEEVFV